MKSQYFSILGVTMHMPTEVMLIPSLRVVATPPINATILEYEALYGCVNVVIMVSLYEDYLTIQLTFPVIVVLFLLVEAEVPEVYHGVLWFNDFIPSPYKLCVHVGEVIEGSVRVTNYITMVEVVITGNIYHICY